MSFELKYQQIKDLVNEDLDCLNSDLKKVFLKNSSLDKDLSAILTAPSKRLRPLLGFLFLRCLYGELNKAQRDILLAVELIHNATLIHDDVIDKAEKRRNQKTLNAKFDNNLAVIAGDFLLSIAMEKVIDSNSVEVIKICTSALKSTCIGEIEQYFGKFKIISIDDYIKKSKQKTALLFQIGLLGGLILSDKNNKKIKKIATEFTENFGIAFQIRDDLINILNSDSLSNNDLTNGIYTAPIIFAYKENSRVLKEKNILKVIKDTKGIEKTKDLMDNYFNQAITAIAPLEDNIYKQAILKLVHTLRTNL